MSRIEEALRRASLATLDPASDDTPDSLALPPVSVARPEPPATLSPRHVETEHAVAAPPTRSVSVVTPEPPAVLRPRHAEPDRAPVAAAPAPVEATTAPAQPTGGFEDAVGEALIGNKRTSPRLRVEKPITGKLIGSPECPAAAGEQYRKIGAVLHQLQLERGVKIVMVASAMAEEGKTLTAANLALTLSESFRRRVLLIDADLRRPTIDKLFKISNVSGLNDGLKSEREQKLTVIEMSPRLSILPAGRPDPDPMSGLTSDRMRTIVAQAGEDFDWVVLDTPPVVLLPDARLLAEMVHAVVFVIGAGATPFRIIERAVTELDRKRIVGVVLNRVTEAAMPSHYYGYYGGDSVASASAS